MTRTDRKATQDAQRWTKRQVHDLLLPNPDCREWDMVCGCCGYYEGGTCTMDWAKMICDSEEFLSGNDARG